MDYSQSIQKVNSLLKFGIKPGLERIGELLNRLGNPQDKLKFVHVAGTNGKGTACTLISNVLTAAGYKTGLYTSPYIMDFRERFRINGEMIPKDELSKLTERVSKIVDEMKQEDLIITEFEFITALAFLWYFEQKCDIVVLEVGLGGRFDATNIINTSIVSVIMSISLDHTAILGDTVEKIAYEKCGIIKPCGQAVVYANQPDGVIPVVENSVKDNKASLTIADDSAVKLIKTDIKGSEFIYSAKGRFGIDSEMKLFIPFIGEHQLRNASTALEALNILYKQGYKITAEAIEKGFRTASFFARLELIGENPIVLLDGAHNPGGAKALANAIKAYLSGKKKILIMGMLADKDVETAVSYIAPNFDKAYTLSPDNPRAMSSEELAKVVSKYCQDVTHLEDYRKAYELAISDAEADGAVVICGSLYLAGKMRHIIFEN